MSDETKTPEQTCAYCGKPLPYYQYHDIAKTPSDRGYVGNGIFCTLRCGYKFGITAYKAGLRRN